MKINNKMDEALDFRRLILYFRKRIWIVLLMAVIGGAIGALGYQVIRSINMPVEYQATSKLYIRFNVDEAGEVYQYYNGYTWNDLLDSNPIMECIMAYLPKYDVNEVMDATQADIISDIRLLNVTITSDNEKSVREIQYAVENGLITYAINSEELKSITPIKSEPPTRIYWKNKTFTSIVVFAVIFSLITFVAYFIGFILDDAIYVQSDIEKRYNYRALGIMPRAQKGLQPYLQELRANILYLLRENKNLLFVDIDDHSELKAVDLERIMNWEQGGSLERVDDGVGELVWHINDEEDDDLIEAPKSKEWKIIPFNSESITITECNLIKENEGVFILVPFGSKGAVRKLERTISYMNNQDINILGIVITDADEDYLLRYFT